MRATQRYHRILGVSPWCIAMAVAVVMPGLGRVAAAQTAAQGAASIVVDGTDWMAADADERHAFLVGVANMIVAEGAYAQRNKQAMPPVSDRIVKAVSDLKFADIESHITRWYEAHPTKRSMPVMGVVWQSIVGKRQ